MFEREWRIRFSNIGPFDIAHYLRIVDAVHETSNIFMQVDYPFWELAQEHKIGLPIVQVDLSFTNPIRAGDVVSIVLTTDLGQQSVRFNYTANCDGEETFAGFEQHVHVPVNGDSAVEIPDDLCASLVSASPEATDGRE